MKLTNRTRIISVSLPVTLLILIQALAVFPTRAAAQCPTMSDEGATYGITRFNTVKSQMWYNDGQWWGALSDNEFLHFYTFPNNAATQGAIIDGNALGIPDVLWDGTNLFIMIWKSVSLSTLYKYSYDSGTKTYTLISGFPVQIPLNGSSTSSIVLDKDSTGKLWATYTGTQGGFSDGHVRVIWSTSADHRTWDTTGAILESGLTPNTLEISAITHFGGNKIGVVWSNQPGKQIAFRYHNDGDPASTWSTKEVIDSGNGPRGLGPVADDHLAIKAAPDGRLFLVAKDNDNDGTSLHAIEGRMWLYVRSAAGVWGPKIIVQPDFSQLPTRPVLLLDVTSNVVYVIYHDESPSGSGRNFITHADMNDPSLNGFDFPCVFSITASTNPTSTKQNVTSSTGIMAAASTGATSTGDIVFRSVDLTPPHPIPSVTSLLPSTIASGGGSFTLTVNGTGFVNGSVVWWNDLELATTFVSDTQITAQVSAAEIAANGTAFVMVFNPLPGGGFSDPPVTFTITPPGYEGDVQPRPNGSNTGVIAISDWVQTGRFAAGLDVPACGSELQRADTAPRATLGNGTITVSDWVQTGRYASGLDPATPAGGPTTGPGCLAVAGPVIATPSRAVASAGDLSTAGARIVRVVNTAQVGQTVTARIELDSQGNENALGFSVAFDPSKLTYVAGSKGSDATGAAFFANESQKASGRVGFILGLSVPDTFAVGTRQIIVMTFNVAASASGSTDINFGDMPIGREISDAGGTGSVQVLPATYTKGTMTITGLPLSSLSPNSAIAGSAGFNLTVNGSNFVNGLVVRWNGSARTTSFVSSTQLTAQITAADIQATGTSPVTVFNPALGGGVSNSVNFAVNNATPSVSGLSPSSVIAGGTAFALTVNGSNFVSGATVNFGGTSHNATFIDPAHLSANIAAAEIATAGMVSVTVTNPGPGGGTSTPALTLQVNNPVATATSLSPSSKIAGEAGFTLTITGSNFVSGATLNFSGTSHITTLLDATHLSADITAPEIATEGPISVTITNPGPGGGTSGAVTFFIYGQPPDPAKLQFGDASFSVLEGAGSAVITVTRSGDASVAASVDYGISDATGYVPCAIVNGLATQNCDYIITTGTLQFAAGEMTKSFTIPIVDDVYVEGDETLNLRLTNANGASLGTLDTAVLTIIDDDMTVPTANPIDQSQVFVRQHYLDFLNREPDSEGLSYWTGQIALCGTDAACIRSRRVAVSNAFFYENEFQETGAYVYRIYKAAFGTRPTYEQFMPDRSRVIGGAQLDQSKTSFANGFVQRTGFLANYPNSTTAAQYVDALNTNTGNSLTQAQRDALVNGLTNNTETSGSVLRKVADNQAFIDSEYGASFVLTEYFGYLRRDPEQEGFDFWLGQVNRFPLRDVGVQHSMVCSFITSTEYQNRFSSVTTSSNAQCGQ